MFSFKDIKDKAELWDSYYNFQRPINEQYLDSYRAFLRLSRDWASIFIYFICFLISLLLLLYVNLKLGQLGFALTSLVRIIPVLVLGILAFVFLATDYNTVKLAYNSFFQRVSMGTARWATKSHLQSKNLLDSADILTNPPPNPQKIPLVPFGIKNYISLDVKNLAQHTLVVGPSGCGKTSTVFNNTIRYFSRIGSVIALEISKSPAGEIFGRTALYFDETYRCDFMYPQHTDHFPIFGRCKGNSVNAGKVANYMIQAGNTKTKTDIWDRAAETMLKLLILHICEFIEEPQPADIFDFLALHPTKVIIPGQKEPINMLKDAMESSPNNDVQIEWAAMFSSVGDDSPKTYGSIVFTMMSYLAIFRDPKVQAVFRPPSDAEKAKGRRTINVESLRRMSCNSRDDGINRGKAVYVVAAEGEADRLRIPIDTVLTICKDILKQSGDKDEDAYVLFALDEAGNNPPQKLSQDFGVGRGRKLPLMLGLQGLSQLIANYGRDIAQTIFENTGTYIIFPGAKDFTAEWVCKMLGKTTTLLRSASDSVNDIYDSEKLTEHGRDLMMPDELRQMRWFTQLIVLINDAMPIRARVNPDSKTLDSRVCEPLDFTVTDAYEPAPVRRNIQPVANTETMRGNLDAENGIDQMPEDQNLVSTELSNPEDSEADQVNEIVEDHETDDELYEVDDIRSSNDYDGNAPQIME